MKIKETKKGLEEIIEDLRKYREELKGVYKVKHLKIFGSYANKEQTDESDLDLIASFEETPTLLEFIELKEYLENITGIKIDLVTEKGISPYIKPYIKAIEVL